MKKMLCVLLIALMLAEMAYAEEEFVLHNGTKFGMSPDEVVSIESGNGVSLEKREYHGIMYKGYAKVAGIDNTEITYYFGEDGLFGMSYEFKSDVFEIDYDEFTNIENGLINKYGETEYSSTTGKYLPSIAVYKNSPDKDPHSFNEDESYNGMLPDLNEAQGVWERILYSHRLIQMNDDSYLFIDHKLYMSDFTNNLSDNPLAGLLPATDSPNKYWHSVEYYLLTAEEAYLFFDSLQTMNDDL